MINDRGVCGIDPGIDGAVALIENGIVQTWDTPTILVHGKNRNKRQYDLPKMREILSIILSNGAFVLIEAVHSMPKQGVASSFSFGHGFGLWEGLLFGLGIAYDRVTPQRWKKVILDGQPKGKGSSLVVVKRLYPDVEFHRVKDHGRADAILIAEYGRRAY